MKFENLRKIYLGSPVLLILISVTFCFIIESCSDPRNSNISDAISVDASKVINDTRRHQTGINMDYLIDDDNNTFLSPKKRKLNQAMEELGAKYLRYPGGWKSALNLWSVPPFTASAPQLLRNEISANEFNQYSDRIVTNPDGSWRIDPYDFDEFMTTCQTAGAIPCVVVAYESLYWPPLAGEKSPSREQLLETAAAWVRYANRVKGYNVKYWEMGNESDINDPHITQKGIPASTYAKDLVEYSRRMKAEDSSIMIGANSFSYDWWKQVLPVAADYIDFLVVHPYPAASGGYTTYEQYRTKNLDALPLVEMTMKAIQDYAPNHINRLKIMVTEWAGGTFGEMEKSPGDMGTALITFDVQGQLLQSPNVYYSQFWNTHNYYVNVDGGVFEAFNLDNSISTVGRSLWIWNHFLLDEMLATTGTEYVRCFATRTEGERMNVFLVNKDTVSRKISLSLNNFPRQKVSADRWCYRGKDANDINPIWKKTDVVIVKDARLKLELEPVSITVLSLPYESSGVTK